MKQLSPGAQSSPRQQRGCSRPWCTRPFVPLHSLLQSIEECYSHTHTHTRPPILATPDVHPDATTIFLYVTIWPAEACRFSHTSAYTLPHCFKAQVCLRLCVRVCLYAYVYGMLIRQGDNWWRGMLADVVCVCVCAMVDCDSYVHWDWNLHGRDMWNGKLPKTWSFSSIQTLIYCFTTMQTCKKKKKKK